MIKGLFTLFFTLTLLNAQSDYELKLYETIIPSIFKDRSVRVYLDKDMQSMLQNSKKFTIVKECDASVKLLIGKRFENLPAVCQDKPLFTTKYRTFKESANSFGAFYWRKGRPQIKFKKSTLLRYKIHLPNSLQRYVNDK
jgi:hypothetical protein